MSTSSNAACMNNALIAQDEIEIAVKSCLIVHLHKELRFYTHV